MLNVENLLKEIYLAQAEADSHPVSFDSSWADLFVLERTISEGFVLIESVWASLQGIVEVDSNLSHEDNEHLMADVSLSNDYLIFTVDTLSELVADVTEHRAIIVAEEWYIEFEVLPQEEFFILRSVVNLGPENLLDRVFASFAEVYVSEPVKFYIASIFFVLNLLCCQSHFRLRVILSLSLCILRLL